MSRPTKLWGGGDGRFGCGMNADLSRLNNSLAVDKRLYGEDIRGSLAYAEILVDSKILQPDEFAVIRSGFKIIQAEWDAGEMVLRDDDEDVHSVNERRLTEIIGDVGRKLHTGRSRNDQVAVDMKLWMKQAIREVLDEVKSLLKVIVTKAERHIDVLMPGYTHLQVRTPFVREMFIQLTRVPASATCSIQPLASLLRFLRAVRLRAIAAVGGTC